MNKTQKGMISVLLLIALLPFVSSAWAPNLDVGLQSYWNMDDGVGTNVLNQINSSADGTLTNGANWTTGILGNATIYDNTLTQYMATPFYLNSGNSDKSVSLWFNIYGNTNDGQNIFSGGAQSPDQFFSLHYDYSFPNHDLYFFGYGTSSFQALGPNVLTLGAWHHAVITYDSATTNTTVYIDGSPVASNIALLTTGSSDTFTIGKYDTTAYLNGSVDEVAVYDRVLNDSEVLQLYNGGSGITWTPPAPPIPPAPFNQSDFLKCKNISVQGGLSTLADFPFYVQVSKEIEMQMNYQDVRITDAPCWQNGNLLPYEFDSFNPSTTANIWVKATLATGTNVFSVYYGNSTAMDAQNSTGVWTDYISVYHFSEQAGGTTKDSAQKGNTGLVSDNSLWNATGAGFGGGITGDGTMKYVISQDNITEITGNGDRGLMFWYTAPLPPTFRVAIAYGITGGGEQEQAFGDIDGIANQNKWMFASNPSSSYTNLTMSATPKFVAFDHNATVSRAFQDGAFDLPYYAITYNTPQSHLIIGGIEYLPPTGYWNGDLDEVRISSKTFSGDYYLRTEENTNLSLFSFGPAQDPPSNVTIPPVTPPHDRTWDL